MKEKIILFGCESSIKDNIKWIQYKYDVIAICDNNKNKDYYGIKCISPEHLTDYDEDVIITANNAKDYKDKKLQVENMGKRTVNIYNKKHNDEKILKHMYIWGWGPELNARYIDAIVTNLCEDIVIDGYVTHITSKIGFDDINGKDRISLCKAKTMLKKGTIDGIIMVTNDFGVCRNIEPEYLENYNFYVVPNKIFRKQSLENDDIESIFTLYKDSNRIGCIQFLVTEKCNLNCRLCSHFSPLANKNEVYDFSLFKKDLHKIRELFDEVDEIGLWGGEALLCNDLEKYIIESRKLFPYSRIIIGTNGLLILNMADSLINAIKENDAVLAVSLYPPTLNKIDEIISFLKKNNIKARYPVTTKVERFSKHYDLKGNNNVEEQFKNCPARFCTTVKDGKIANCYFPIVAKNFNNYFEEKFDVENDCIELQTAERDLYKYLRQPLNACRYCGDIKLEKWSALRGKASVEDFAYL